MQVEGKSIESVMQEFNEKFVWFQKGDSGIGGNDPTEYDEGWSDLPSEFRPWLKRALASVLLHAKSKMPEKQVPDSLDTNPFEIARMATYNFAIDDCHAVFDEEIAKALV